MLEKILHVGNKLELRKINAVGREDNSGKYYVSSICELFDDNRIGLLMPMERGQVIPLEPDEKYKLYFYTDNGLYQCKAVIKERYKKDRIYIAVCKFISDFEKLQRRQFFRIGCLINIKYRLVESIVKDPDNELPGPWNSATAIDISGGGMRFVADEYRGNDSKYEIEFDIPIDNLMSHLKVVARIVYISDMANRSEMYEYRLEFTVIEPKQREVIVRFVFDEERKRRSKDI